eukprot:COSAG02_NODE_3913_length_6051_cov_4.275874_1_plen_429_part_00
MRAAAALLPLLFCPPRPGDSSSLIFVTDDMDNDVVSLLRSEHGSAGIRRAPSPDAALRDSATGDTILFLADGYPHEQLATPVLAAATDDRDLFWRQAAAKGVKVFLEFPSELPRNATPGSPAPKDRTSDGLPCLARPAAVAPGMAVNFTYVNHDKSLCAAMSCNMNLAPVQTYFHGRHCGVRDQLIWDTFETPHGTHPASACKWNRTNAPEYSGTGCGVAPVYGGTNSCGENITEHLPMLFCPPVGFARAGIGGSWAGGSSQGPQSVDACAKACQHANGCRAFTVSDEAKCEIFHGELHGFIPSANTSAFLRHANTTPNATKPLTLHAIQLKSWQALRPSTGAQPAAYMGVLAPRLPQPVAAAWKRVGMPPLGIFMHHAAQSTIPESWPLYAPQYCHSIPNGTWHSLDCSIETDAVVPPISPSLQLLV